MSYGCATGTVAKRPFRTWLDWSETPFERCPLAILRDSTTDEIASVNWAISMAVAKRQGSLAAYIAPGTLSARGDALIDYAENVMCARDEETLAKIREGH